MTCRECTFAIGAVRRQSIPVELRLQFEGDQALMVDQSDQHANCERTAAESEAKMRSAFVEVKAEKVVEIEDVAFHPLAEGAPDHAQELETGGPNAVVEECDLASV